MQCLVLDYKKKGKPKPFFNIKIKNLKDKETLDF